MGNDLEKEIEAAANFRRELIAALGCADAPNQMLLNEVRRLKHCESRAQQLRHALTDFL